ncbi:MAG TPA: NUDIX domain-containing protein [Thermomicrobiales bacterium]|nr:NUDIX domain-containing protein [Thermomicrobiales bacterium]HRA31038.1 NUDIX domain-containing protein [Thermomicrobiales bacterium]
MTEQPGRPPRNVTSVGALVVRESSLLVVRMTYGPSQGRYMLPGGLLDPGETLDVAAAREVREETGVEARPLGIVGLRSRYDGPNTDTYILWLLEHLSGEPAGDGQENDDARYLSFVDIAQRDDVVYLVKYLATRLATGAILPHSHADDYAYQFPGSTPDSWKLFM